VENKLKIKIN